MGFSMVFKLISIGVIRRMDWHSRSLARLLGFFAFALVSYPGSTSRSSYTYLPLDLMMNNSHPLSMPCDICFLFRVERLRNGKTFQSAELLPRSG